MPGKFYTVFGVFAMVQQKESRLPFRSLHSFPNNFPLDQKNSTFSYLFADTGREGKMDYPENNANDGYGEPKYVKRPC